MFVQALLFSHLNRSHYRSSLFIWPSLCLVQITNAETKKYRKNTIGANVLQICLVTTVPVFSSVDLGKGRLVLCSVQVGGWSRPSHINVGSELTSMHVDINW